MQFPINCCSNYKRQVQTWGVRDLAGKWEGEQSYPVDWRQIDQERQTPPITYIRVYLFYLYDQGATCTKKMKKWKKL